jgi:serine/threonine-protein kinase
MLAVSATVGSEQAIYLRRIGEADFRKVPDTDNGRFPSFSPDGQWLVFRDNSENTLVKVAVAGGGALTLVDDDAISPFDPHWGENDVIVFTGPQGIFTVSATGGVPRQHTISASGRNPHLLPDGRGALIVPGGAGGSSIEYLDLESDSSWVIVPEGRHATYVATGHVLYAPPSGGLFAVPFDLDAREVTGPPRRVLNRVAFSNVRRGYSVSRRGILVHLEGEGVAFGTGGLQTRFLIVDRAGAIDTIRHPSGVNFDPRFSPDGRKIAYEFAGRGGESHIYTYDLLTGTNPQITFEGDNDDPEWSPDGTRLMFNSDRGESGDDIYVKAADNSGEAELVLSRPGGLFVSHWFREDTILVEALDEQLDLLVHSGLADDTARPFLQAPWDEFVARVSPDGKLVAYSSEETGEEEIWLQDFPVPAGKRRVSFGGDAAGARWSPDGSLLYFWRAGGGRTIDSLFSVRIERTPSVVVHQPEYVFGTDITGGSNSWDLHPDGERFVITVAEGSPEPAAAAASGVPATRYLVVLNWFEELKERLGNR